MFIRFVPLSWACFTGFSTSNLYFTWLVVIRKFKNDDVEEEEEGRGDDDDDDDADADADADADVDDDDDGEEELEAMKGDNDDNG